MSCLHFMFEILYNLCWNLSENCLKRSEFSFHFLSDQSAYMFPLPVPACRNRFIYHSPELWRYAPNPFLYVQKFHFCWAIQWQGHLCSIYSKEKVITPQMAATLQQNWYFIRLSLSPIPSVGFGSIKSKEFMSSPRWLQRVFP